MLGRIEMTRPHGGEPRPGIVRTQLAVSLQVPDTDVTAGLCQAHEIGWSKYGAPLYDPVEAVKTMREYYRRMYEHNKQRWRDRKMGQWRDYALKYLARMERCDALLAELERGSE